MCGMMKKGFLLDVADEGEDPNLVDVWFRIPGERDFDLEEAMFEDEMERGATEEFSEAELAELEDDLLRRG